VDPRALLLIKHLLFVVKVLVLVVNEDGMREVLQLDVCLLLLAYLLQLGGFSALLAHFAQVVRRHFIAVLDF
jgi:nitrate/nitrite transporter NarK